MANVLEKIVADKQLEIQQRKIDLPLEQFIHQLTPSDRSFYAALAQLNAGYIFECKKASPSKGLIREQFDLDEIIQAYRADAACISVLTEEKYFQGKFEYLRYVRQNLPQPVLNKDFFIDPYQVYLARYHHADAILLMLSVLDDAQYQALAQIAEQLQLDVLTEVSNEQECLRAVNLGAKIIGINNRNLRDLSTDLATTEALAPLLRRAGHQGLLISESGIYTNEQVRRLAPLVDGFLVGSALMAEDNLNQAVKKLVYGKHKVCGITRAQDVTQIRECGAHYAGLIFAKKSPRCITLADAHDLVATVPFNYVGVFVEHSVTEIADIATQLQLAAVQLHGAQSQHFIDQLRPLLPVNCQIWLALGIEKSLPTMDQQQVDRFLLDCKVGKQSGGTGQSFDWQLLEQIDNKAKITLAGGLTPANLKQALATGISQLDINSGVESSAGIKDPDKLTQAFSVLRQY